MKLRPLPFEKVIYVLNKIGFKIIRQKGSHIFLQHPDGRTTVVPAHRGEEIGRGLLRKIIRDAEISRDEFLNLID